jgi:hypothetical protein
LSIDNRNLFIVEATGANLGLINPSMAIMVVALIRAILAKVFFYPKMPDQLMMKVFGKKIEIP